MTETLRRSGCFGKLLDFSIACCSRIRDQLPSETAFDILDQLELGCGDGTLRKRIVEREPTLRQELDYFHGRMAVGRHETPGHSLRAANDYNSLNALITTIESFRDPTGGGESVVSQMVADVVATRAMLLADHVGETNLDVFHASYDGYFRLELEQHCNLLRKIQPLPPLNS